jgi:hypothetical protein
MISQLEPVQADLSSEVMVQHLRNEDIRSASNQENSDA